MSKKQLGAAPGEESNPEAGQKLGWFGRLRAQPGFRTASIAFVLTVVLGIGSTAAYAWWSVTTPVTISGSTAYNLPQPAGPRCVTATPRNKVEWDSVVGADPEAKYILTFQARGESVSYAVPLSSPSVEPATLLALRDKFENTWLSKYPLTVTLRTAIIPTSVKGITQVEEDLVNKSPKSESSVPLQMFYMTSLWTNYPCS